jgi:hypothetical protein
LGIAYFQDALHLSTRTDIKCSANLLTLQSGRHSPDKRCQPFPLSIGGIHTTNASWKTFRTYPHYLKHKKTEIRTMIFRTKYAASQTRKEGATQHPKQKTDQLKSITNSIFLTLNQLKIWL